jgi:cyclopropane-fatty-acyl-phospholipid synthase
MAQSPLESRKTRLLNALFQAYEGPAFAIRLWDGWQWSSRPNAPPVFTLVVATPAALASLAAGADEVALGEAFIEREIEVEGDLFSVFSVAEFLFNRPGGWKQQVLSLVSRFAAGSRRWFRHGALHSPRRDRSSIAYHYDQPVEFFRPWLGASLVYSCAYFRNPGESLDSAQTEKLEMVCRKLRLQAGERFLDIGCGWGSLILHAAAHHGALAHGITLSEQQAEVAARRIEEAGLNGACVAELRDYRHTGNLYGSFDKIASIGMFEHVGLSNLHQYFTTARSLLRPGGVFLNHGIARAFHTPVRQSSFIDRYVFPDGRLVTLAQALDAAESAGLEVRDVENLREHYELTARHWVQALQSNRSTLRNYVSETTYRIWLLYMAGSAAYFRSGDVAVYQVLLSRPGHGQSGLPLLRDDWYAARNTA